MPFSRHIGKTCPNNTVFQCAKVAFVVFKHRARKKSEWYAWTLCVTRNEKRPGQRVALGAARPLPLTSGDPLPRRMTLTSQSEAGSVNFY